MMQLIFELPLKVLLKKPPGYLRPHEQELACSVRSLTSWGGVLIGDLLTE